MMGWKSVDMGRDGSISTWGRTHVMPPSCNLFIHRDKSFPTGLCTLYQWLILNQIGIHPEGEFQGVQGPQIRKYKLFIYLFWNTSIDLFITDLAELIAVIVSSCFS